MKAYISNTLTQLAALCAPCVVGARDGANYGDFAINADCNFSVKIFRILLSFLIFSLYLCSQSTTKRDGVSEREECVHTEVAKSVNGCEDDIK